MERKSEVSFAGIVESAAGTVADEAGQKKRQMLFIYIVIGYIGAPKGSWHILYERGLWKIGMEGSIRTLAKRAGAG